MKPSSIAGTSFLNGRLFSAMTRAAKHLRLVNWSELILQSGIILRRSMGLWAAAFLASMWAPFSRRSSTIWNSRTGGSARCPRGYVFFQRCPGRGANLGSLWLSFIFSHKCSALDHSATAPPRGYVVMDRVSDVVLPHLGSIPEASKCFSPLADEVVGKKSSQSWWNGMM